MRWLLDECVGAALVVRLRQGGHDARYVAEISPRAGDTEVMLLANADNRLLLTEDKDFGDLIFQQARSVPGLVLLRISTARRLLKAERLIAAVERFGDDLLGRYTAKEEARFRSRPLRAA